MLVFELNQGILFGKKIGLMQKQGKIWSLFPVFIPDFFPNLFFHGKYSIWNALSWYVLGILDWKFIQWKKIADKLHRKEVITKAFF